MNGLTSKILLGCGYIFVAFVYGAGAYSVAKGGSDIRNLKRRMDDLEDGLINLDEHFSNRLDDIRENIRDINGRMYSAESDITTLEIGNHLKDLELITYKNEIAALKQKINDKFGVESCEKDEEDAQK